ncbi:hypothetical protein EDB86DRAFT_3080197 [Lactarius hatsudake]|nr:hypothetical protein EDB86DRAFT_3080197 [Lactarius hatsudake]
MSPYQPYPRHRHGHPTLTIAVTTIASGHSVDHVHLVQYKPRVLVSQIWNVIVISMYREHLLSINHVQKLLYHQTNKGFKGSFRVFPPGSEAECQILFFTQSLTKALPKVLLVDAMLDYTEKEEPHNDGGEPHLYFAVTPPQGR